MTINEAYVLAVSLKNKHPELSSWKVSFNNRKKAFGICNYRTREISLSKLFIPFMTDEAVKDTIVHEIAHALTMGHDHDNVWKRKCIELGGNGYRISGVENFKNGIDGILEFGAKNCKYTLTCPTCGCKVHLNRKPKLTRSCGEHGDTRYNPLHKMILTQNY